jgi:hypothetical protein
MGPVSILATHVGANRQRWKQPRHWPPGKRGYCGTLSSASLSVEITCSRTIHLQDPEAPVVLQPLDGSRPASPAAVSRTSSILESLPPAAPPPAAADAGRATDAAELVLIKSGFLRTHVGTMRGWQRRFVTVNAQSFIMRRKGPNDQVSFAFDLASCMVAESSDKNKMHSFR